MKRILVTQKLLLTGWCWSCQRCHHWEIRLPIEIRILELSGKKYRKELKGVGPRNGGGWHLMKLIRINYSTLWKESSIQLILDQELAILRRHEVNFTRKRITTLDKISVNHRFANSLWDILKVLWRKWRGLMSRQFIYRCRRWTQNKMLRIIKWSAWTCLPCSNTSTTKALIHEGILEINHKIRFRGYFIPSWVTQPWKYTNLKGMYRSTGLCLQVMVQRTYLGETSGIFVLIWTQEAKKNLN